MKSRRPRTHRVYQLMPGPFALSLSKGRPSVVQQAHHERTGQHTVENRKTLPAPTVSIDNPASVSV